MTRALYTASDLATWCSVELRTIHNWMRRMPIRHQRTNGGQVRFSRLDAVDFLRGQGLPVPRALRNVIPRVALVTASIAVRKLAAGALGKRFEILAHEHILGAAVDAERDEIEAIVVDALPEDRTLPALLEQWSAHPRLEPIRRVAFLASPHPGLDRHVVATAWHATPGKLRAALEETLACRV